jgi:hypothetical protein
MAKRTRKSAAGYTGEARGCYRPAEFEIRYGIGHTLLCRLLKSGEIKSRKLGGARIILHDDAEAWAHSLPIATDENKKDVTAAVAGQRRKAA